jgi:hypothetical protein
MSGFFANLAARALDAKDAVRPRLPSRFEPAEAGPALPAAAIERAVERERPEDGARRDGVAAPVAGDAVPQLVVPRRIAARSTPEPRADSAEGNDRPVAPPPLARTADAHAAGGTAAPATPHGAPRAPAPNPGAARTRAANEDDAPQSDHVVAPQIRRDSARAAVSKDAARRQPASEESASESERAPAARTARPAAGDANIVPAPPAAGAIAPRGLVTPERRPPAAVRHAPETRIQVSIGRVEVRATAQPAQGRRDSAPPAVMSLGEYLRSRAERAR